MARAGVAMSIEYTHSASIKLTDERWYQALGEVAASIGTPRFHQHLLSLFMKSVSNDAGWIIRYSRVSPPDVFHTFGVPQSVVEFYNDKCLHIDPFSLLWKNTAQTGVLTLSELNKTNAESVIYSDVFRPGANVMDELGMFFPTVGHCCFGLFLERERGFFSRSDIRRAELIFPALEGLHRSHLGVLFNSLQYTEDSEAGDLTSRPTLIRDHRKFDVFSNNSWKQALEEDETILPLLEAFDPIRGVQSLYSRDYILTSDAFDRGFSLAPGGRIFMLQPRGSRQEEEVDQHRAAEILATLTRRERDILSLTMNGRSTGQIAQHLEISKGTVKNCKLRLYRKAGVSAERDLIRMFGKLFIP
ncbi:DNA-binding CsgD family transcriptional regulator [Methylobacterium sp. R2-1]|nr:DNA-binding CsgD family transcriptional regulator [Methylobacterium sp. R2-1]